ncbi:MAG: thiosulfate sulfurtransferase [Deltaproteobacteria bacterium]|nr:MAG: thiosulfate sulfurtransferase [Deltaproteobacteria bacterium]
MNEISTKQLEKIIGSESHCIFDARPIDAYNGWALEGERRSGHIRGAKTIPVSWSDEEDWDEIVRTKGALPSHQIVVYGYTRDDAVEVAERFVGSGYKEVSVYTRFVEEWAANPSLPIERMERFEKLVYPRWVYQLVSGESPPGFNGNKYAICHCHYRNKADYDIGHIPGAIALDTLELEAPDTWNRRSPQELEQALMRLGISADTTVVVYGRFSSPRNSDPHPGSSAGHLGSIRCGVLMMYAGVRDIRVLNGSIAAWGNEDYPLSTDEVQLEPVSEFGASVPARSEIFIDTPQAKEVLESDNGNLVSVRSWDEFIGKVSGYNYIFKKGRIPGAIFGNCGSDAYHMENYRNVDLTTREYHEIKAMWNDSGVTSDQFNAFYCGTGWRASEAFLNAYLMGWNKIAVYDGGWYEWSNDPANPIDLGEPF